MQRRPSISPKSRSNGAFTVMTLPSPSFGHPADSACGFPISSFRGAAIANAIRLKVDNAGRIILPKPVRDHFQPREGSDLLLERPDALTLRPVEQPGYEILPDTAALVAASVSNHPPFASSWPRCSSSAKSTSPDIPIANTLSEAYAILTRTPFAPPAYTIEAWNLLSANILS